MGKPRLRYVTLAIFSAMLLAFAACGSGDDSTPTPEGEGTVSGTLVIGPLCPVEPCTNPINPYTGLQIVVRTDTETIATIDVGEDGSFSGVVPAGEYVLDVTPCLHLGCGAVLPGSVTVRDGQDSRVPLNIDTGIR
jgi:hypothetical protein